MLPAGGRRSGGALASRKCSRAGQGAHDVQDLSGIHRVSRCELEIVRRPWPFAEEHAVAIDAHWRTAASQNPNLFNGTIYMARAAAITASPAGATFHATLSATEFKAYFYWREQAFPEVGARDLFGSALIRSAEGHVVLGRQRRGINAGLAYLPGGFIDPRDVTSEARVDLDASIAREIAEETGLGGEDLTALPGYILTFAEPLFSIAREHRSRLAGEAIRARIRAHIESDPAAELADAVIVRHAGDLVDLAMPAYARVLLGWLFPPA